MRWYLLYLAIREKQISLSKMKFLVLAACVCLAVAQPQRNPFSAAASATANTAATAARVAASPFVAGAEAAAEVLRSSYDVRPDGFNSESETSNGISSQVVGTLQKVGEQEALVFQGSYKYTAPDGTPIDVTYVANENGFQPQGAVLPTPPPTPDYILRSLDYIAAHPYAEVQKYN